jgi:hypothetical protein
MATHRRSARTPQRKIPKFSRKVFTRKKPRTTPKRQRGQRR